MRFELEIESSLRIYWCPMIAVKLDLALVLSDSLEEWISLKEITSKGPSKKDV